MITNIDRKCKEPNGDSLLHRDCGGRLDPFEGEGDYLYLSQKGSHEVIARRQTVRFWQCDRCGLRGELCL